MKTALAAVPAALLLLAGCTSSPEPSGSSTALGGGSTAGSASTSAGATGTDPATTTDSATSSATGSATGSATSSATTEAAAPTALPTTFTDVNQTITDTDLKDSITVKRLARAIPWPAGYKASAQAYELVGLELTWTPSKDYTIPIREQDFAVNTGSQFLGRPDPLVDETLKAAGWALLPDQVDKGDPVTGWVVFKVDPKDAPKLVLDYTRPAVQVSGSSTTFPAKTFSVPVVGG